ncbi:hypothetical protein D3C76_647260 [compost metagenome]|jgi:hypothetical protein|uniref:Uncharacterized protein n=1 Tax=Pseudomonas capeferrum TaxID=1495066 RepID=A0ABY7RFS9_9PSED|nr:hypothetical protein [Pseudomonas capeferrum]MUT50377.1 hypothetical protein [Pseudomonas sp. TDA1]WCI02648.1 hypothetical protein PMC74_12480 [Pseudomonas capeferrum]
MDWQDADQGRFGLMKQYQALLAGRKHVLEKIGGTYVEPNIFDGVTNAMKITQDESSVNLIDAEQKASLRKPQHWV